MKMKIGMLMLLITSTMADSESLLLPLALLIAGTALIVLDLAGGR